MPCHGKGKMQLQLHLDSIVQSGVISLNLPNKQRVNDIRAARVLQVTVQEQSVS